MNRHIAVPASRCSRDCLAPPAVHDVVRMRGEALPDRTRYELEPRFSQDFSHVRVHTDDRAARSAVAVGANAYTVGHHVVFAAGQYHPSSLKGMALIAHELTHVMQQRHAASGGTGTLRVSSNEAHEREAREVASEGYVGASASGSRSEMVVQRQPAPIDKEKDVSLQPTINPDLIDLTLNVLRGRHQLRLEAGLTEPLNLFGVQLPGVGPSQLDLALTYDNRCNQAFQHALVGMQQRQPAGGRVVDFKRNEWDINAEARFRRGSVLIGVGGTVGFRGSDFDSVLFALSFTQGVSQAIPDNCVAPPPKPDTPEVPSKGPPTPRRTPDRDPPAQRTGSSSPTLSPMTIYFFYDTDIVRPVSEQAVRILTQTLTGVPALRIMLTGHTSLEGTDARNLDLSKRRARAIETRLVLAGVEADRIATLGVGESTPAVPEPDAPSRSFLPSVERIRNLNRRVEVAFIDPTGKYIPELGAWRLPEPQLRRLASPPWSLTGEIE